MAKTEIVTPVGMVMFPNFFQPRPRQPGSSELIYNCLLKFDRKAQETEAFKELKRAINAEAKDFFQGKPPANARNPLIRAGDTEYPQKYDGFHEDDVFIRPWSKYQPGIIDARRNDITIEGDVWAGQLFRATVAPAGYSAQGNKGVTLMLNNLQQARADMPRMDGRKSAAASFDALEDTGDSGGGGGDMADADEEDFFN